MKQDEFLEIFKLLELNYGRKMPDEIVVIWYEKFKNVSKEVFKESVINTIEWDYNFPTMHAVDVRVENNSRRVF